MTFIVGLTGGIGSGKSTVARMFADFGAPVIDADVVSRELVGPSQQAFTKIVERYGPIIVDSSGNINRALLREKIFEQPEEKQWLEALLHPAIYLQIQNKISEIDYPYCIVVIPLLTEHYDQYQKIVDHVLVVDASANQQIAWTTGRDHCSVDLVKKIMAAQASPEERAHIADTLLLNAGDIDELRNKIKDLHQMFLNKSKG